MRANWIQKQIQTDHIHVVNKLMEKCREYNIPLCIAFVDYEKAFDSVQTKAVLTSLQEQGIEDVYIELLEEILVIVVSPTTYSYALILHMNYKHATGIS